MFYQYLKVMPNEYHCLMKKTLEGQCDYLAKRAMQDDLFQSILGHLEISDVKQTTFSLGLIIVRLL